MDLAREIQHVIFLLQDAIQRLILIDDNLLGEPLSKQPAQARGGPHHHIIITPTRLHLLVMLLQIQIPGQATQLSALPLLRDPVFPTKTQSQGHFIKRLPPMLAATMHRPLMIKFRTCRTFLSEAEGAMNVL